MGKYNIKVIHCKYLCLGVYISQPSTEKIVSFSVNGSYYCRKYIHGKLPNKVLEVIIKCNTCNKGNNVNSISLIKSSLFAL